MKSGTKVGMSLCLGVFMRLNADCTGKKSVAEEPELAHSNPLPVQLGDPYVSLISDRRYYMYGIGARTIDGFCVYSSDNLTYWKSKERVYRGNTPDSWAITNLWTPGVYERNGKFYMFFSADWRKDPANEGENFRTGVAVPDKPTGPFKGLTDAPLFDPGHPVIDGDLIEDEDGRTCLYYSRCYYKYPVESEAADEAKEKDMFDFVEEGWIYRVEVIPDLTHVIREPVLLLHPPIKLDDV